MPYIFIPGLLPDQLTEAQKASGRYVEGPNGQWYVKPAGGAFANQTPWLQYVAEERPAPPAPPKRRASQLIRLFPLDEGDRSNFLRLMGAIAAEGMESQTSRDGVVVFGVGGVRYLPDFTRKPWDKISDALFAAGLDPSEFSMQAYVSVSGAGFPGGMHWAKEDVLAVAHAKYEGRHSLSAMMHGDGSFWVLAAELKAAIAGKRSTETG